MPRSRRLRHAFHASGASLQAKSTEYSVSTWTRTSIVADNTDANPCGEASRLTIDFKSNSVVVTDYPTSTWILITIQETHAMLGIACADLNMAHDSESLR